MEIAKCDREVNDFCKTDKERDDFFFDSFLLILRNSIRFDQNLYGEESIISESVIDGLNINSQTF